MDGWILNFHNEHLRKAIKNGINWEKNGEFQQDRDSSDTNPRKNENFSGNDGFPLFLVPQKSRFFFLNFYFLYLSLIGHDKGSVAVEEEEKKLIIALKIYKIPAIPHLFPWEQQERYRNSCRWHQGGFNSGILIPFFSPQPEPTPSQNNSWGKKCRKENGKNQSGNAEI